MNQIPSVRAWSAPVSSDVAAEGGSFGIGNVLLARLRSPVVDGGEHDAFKLSAGARGVGRDGDVCDAFDLQRRHSPMSDVIQKTATTSTISVLLRDKTIRLNQSSLFRDFHLFSSTASEGKLSATTFGCGRPITGKGVLPGRVTNAAEKPARVGTHCFPHVRSNHAAGRRGHPQIMSDHVINPRDGLISLYPVNRELPFKK
jgi:hypothetical protein